MGLKNYQVGEKWILDDYLYLYKGLTIKSLCKFCCSVVLLLT
ncbi:hypothetical protein THERMOT_1378 [Bathymodiolus thermophilus thioautotrophic gill symbiont]|nr:hypothetical protein THERMOT_1378 [Bathymodiolus thermophilus thioautotrophic gill symbiont]